MKEQDIYKMAVMVCSVCKNEFNEELELMNPVKEGQGVLCYCRFCRFPVIAKFKCFL